MEYEHHLHTNARWILVHIVLIWHIVALLTRIYLIHAQDMHWQYMQKNATLQIYALVYILLACAYLCIFLQGYHFTNRPQFRLTETHSRTPPCPEHCPQASYVYIVKAIKGLPGPAVNVCVRAHRHRAHGKVPQAAAASFAAAAAGAAAAFEAATATSPPPSP